jgi:electron transport complex protein RnfB
MADQPSDRNRRDFIRDGLKTTTVLAVGSLGGLLASRAASGTTVWQIDPNVCVQCERCATTCVLTPSAVKCVHAFNMCGYCALCGGYQNPKSKVQSTAAENQLCPTGAIIRTFVEAPFFEYRIDESLCFGCGKCVKGCAAFGNGSLYLQIRHDLCLNCNQCSIALECPSGAVRQVPAGQDKGYLLKGIGLEEPSPVVEAGTEGEGQE